MNAETPVPDGLAVVQPTSESGEAGASPSNVGNAPEFALGEITAGAAALLLGMLYGLGFIVSNAHLEKVEVLTFELFRVRYFAAAALFLLLTFIPITLFIFAFREISRDLSAWRTSRLERVTASAGGKLISVSLQSAYRARAWKLMLRILWLHFWLDLGSALFALLLVWVIWRFAIIGTFIVSDSGTSRISSIYLIVVTFIGASGYLRLRETVPTRAEIKERLFGVRFSHLENWTLCLFSLVGLAVYFGQAMYPNVRPAFGGGGAWAAALTVDTTSVPQAIQGALAESAVIVDQDANHVRVVTCRFSNARGASTQALELPRNAVLVARIDSLVTLPKYRDWCSRRMRIPNGGPAADSTLSRPPASRG